MTGAGELRVDATRGSEAPSFVGQPVPPVSPSGTGSSTLTGSTGVPNVMADPEATSYPRQPGRFLEPELAAAIKRAKLETRASWARVSRVTGLSKAFLIQLSNGHRVPSARTVEILGRNLPIHEHDMDRLRDVASRHRAR